MTEPIVTWLVRPRWGGEEDPKILAHAHELAAFIRDGWDGDGSHAYCFDPRRYAVLRLVNGVIDPEWASVT